MTKSYSSNEEIKVEQGSNPDRLGITHSFNSAVKVIFTMLIGCPSPLALVAIMIDAIGAT